MKKIFIIIFTMLIVLGCSSKKSTFILDNPTDTAINVKLDGKEYKLNSGEYASLTLAPGKHTLTEADGKEISFIVYADSKGGVINPTKSDYIYVSIAYAAEGAGDMFRPAGEDIIVNGLKYEGPFGITDDLIIDKNMKDWKYDIHTPFPDTIYTRDRNSKGNIFTKIFTQKEFLAFVNEMGILGTQAEESQIKKDKAEKPAVEYKVPPFKNPKVKQYAEEMSELDKAYATAVKAGEQKKIMSEYKKAWKNYVQASMEDNSDLELLNELKFNNLGRGVIIIE
jgi:hypothetical protein